MDPKECLRLLLNAVKNADTDAINEHRDNLTSWLCGGGFSPVVYWNGEPCDVIMTYADDELCLRTRKGLLRAVPIAQLSLEA